MKLLIEAIVKALVDKQDEVQIKEVIGEHAHVLELRVARQRSHDELASLYEALDRRKARPWRATQRISARNVAPDDAKLLDIDAGDAVLQIERVSYLESGRAIEFTRSVYRGDAYDFVAELRIGDGAAESAGR